MKKEKINGYVVYEGKSRINGKNIVAIVTMESSNVKTGNMASMWILNADESPIEASKSGNDDSVCGMCPHRHFSGGSCYVTLFQAPLQVYKSWKNGKYRIMDNVNVFEGMKMRFEIGDMVKVEGKRGQIVNWSFDEGNVWQVAIDGEVYDCYDEEMEFLS